MDREEVAHELRTPMTTIKGVLRLLTVGRLAEFSPEDAADLLDRAWQQVRKMEEVIGEVEAQFGSSADTEEAIVICEEPAA